MPPKRMRSTRYLDPACDSCFIKKKKCNRQDPCQRCVRTNQQCTFLLTKQRQDAGTLQSKPKDYDHLRNKHAKICRLVDAYDQAEMPDLNAFFQELKHVVRTNPSQYHVLQNNAIDQCSDVSLTFKQYAEDKIYGCPMRQMPSLEIATKMADEYFMHHHTSYPFLDKIAWYKMFEKCYTEGEALSAHELFSILMVLAIGECCLKRNVEKYEPCPIDLHTLARNIPFMNHTYPDKPDKRYIERMLLLNGYSYFSPRRSGNIWDLVGVACRQVLALGYHRMQPFNISVKEAELRSRMFWSVYSADRLVSTTLGLPLGIHDDDVAVEFPSLMNDSFEPVSLVQDGQVSAIGRSRLSFQYRKIEGIVFNILYSKKTAMNEPEIERLMLFLKEKADQWHLQAQEVFDAASEDVLRCSSRPREYYTFQYEQLVSRIFGPSPSCPEPLPRFSNTLLESCKNVTRLVHILVNQCKMSLNWVTMYGILTNCIVFVKFHYIAGWDANCIHYIKLSTNILDQYDLQWTKAHEASSVLKKVVKSLSDMNSLDSKMQINNLSCEMLGFGSAYVSNNWEWDNMEIFAETVLDWFGGVAGDEVP